MATQVQFRRGTTAQTSTFTGATAEITIDTDKEVVVVHDGVTAGGYPLARESALTANVASITGAFNTANAAFTAANSAGSYANSAFLVANSAASYSNTVNNTQNNSITAAFSAANAATATDTTQNNSITAAFTAANSAGVYANGAFVAANTADVKATSAGVYANGAFVAANTADNKATSAGVYSNGAFTAANSAGSYANSAFLVANSAATYSNTVNDTQNNSITAAFTAANSAGVYANGAFNQANAAFTRANNSISANTGGTITGDLTVTQNLSVGNLFVSGQTFSVSAGTIVANDTLIILGEGNYLSDTKDIGFAGHYNDGTNAHSGIIRDIGTKEWFLFKNYTPEIDANNNVIISDPSFTIDTLNANLKSTTITIKGIDLLPYVNSAYTAANTADNKATSAGVYANGAFDKANTDFTNITISPSQTYGNASYYPVITVSANGRINAISTQVVTDPSAIAFAIALG